MSSGYSSRSTAEKLGVKPGDQVHIVNEPIPYAELIGCDVAAPDGPPYSFAHAFFTDSGRYKGWLEDFVRELAPDGVLWVSWPKRTSQHKSDLSDNVVRDIALPLGIVDIKVCAVNETWSGLKFMVRKDLRANWPAVKT
ncbi:MAG: DUF3052 family protein [Armatimonadetes bacterium]|nr:DUF3052 family protein [Armatimonadota bacterium]